MPDAKVLVVGYGSIGRRHAETLGRRPGVSLAVAEPSRDSAAAAQRDHPEAEVFSSLDDGLRWRPDAVLLCTPSHLHAPMVLRAAREVAAIFVEKPLAVSLKEGRDLVRALPEGVRLTVGYNWRYSDGFRTLASVLRSRALGAPRTFVSVAASYLPHWRPGDYREHYSARRAEGGGILLDFSHETNYLVSLFGAPGSVSCFARNTGALGIDAEEVADVSWDSHGFGGVCHMDYLSRTRMRFLAVALDRGTATWDLERGEVSTEGESGRTVAVAGETAQGTYRREMEAFLASLDGHGEPPTDARDALETLKVVEACRTASAERRVVRLEEFA